MTLMDSDSARNPTKNFLGWFKYCCWCWSADGSGDAFEKWNRLEFPLDLLSWDLSKVRDDTGS